MRCHLLCPTCSAAGWFSRQERQWRHVSLLVAGPDENRDPLAMTLRSFDARHEAMCLKLLTEASQIGLDAHRRNYPAATRATSGVRQKIRQRSGNDGSG